MLTGKGRTPSGAKKTELVRTVGRWHAVSIETVPGCCHFARGLREARFLSADAPILPLPNCTAKERCRCLYKHHEDRRGQLRRREEITGLRANVRIVEERRVERDRRKSDDS